MSADTAEPAHESSNFRPGEPLREWNSGEEIVPVDAELLIKSAHAGQAIRKLVSGEPLTTEDTITFGRLNSWCVLRWYEPMVVLIDEPRIHPALPTLLRDHTKVLNEEPPVVLTPRTCT
jgi:hypothetical protein